MTPHQSGHRRASIPTNKSNKHTAHSPELHSPSGPSNSALYTTRSNEISDDSGFFSAGSTSTSPARPYRDFQLYDSDPDYLDEEASVFPNNGSIYQGRSSTHHDSEIPRCSTRTTALNSGKKSNRPSQGTVYQSVESDRPSLFGEYQELYASTLTTNQLYQWVVQPWNSEERAVHFEGQSLPTYQDEDIRLTPEPASPPRSSKHRKSRSGRSKSVRRRNH